jgi:hypothetical protein
VVAPRLGPSDLTEHGFIVASIDYRKNVPGERLLVRPVSRPRTIELHCGQRDSQHPDTRTGGGRQERAGGNDYVQGKSAPLSEDLAPARGSSLMPVLIYGKDSCPLHADARGNSRQPREASISTSRRTPPRSAGCSNDRRPSVPVIVEDGTVTIGFGGT